ncbi:ABC transporter permease [Desulfobacter postgatei]|uniref:ABC-type Fe3+ transport system, permease component n=1 Tax=Desulfobacter postgatei 2ac9 TaxID=879212 RepID=I5B0G2_9BACT|nr:ABC transporter permease subunit [Desulfobacter postgatei]EIM62975.1 ABC-type Fe3+ transport system, permease component [Desulfobacter postgatei 2ac9]
MRGFPQLKKKIYEKFLTLCASIPFVLPAVVVAAALDASFGKNGWLGILNIRHPLVLIFMAHVFYNFSVMLRILTSFWTGLRGNIQETAAMLGAGPYQIFIHVTLPLLMPAVWVASFLVFIFCFSSFGIILILGGPAYSTIEAEIFRQAAHMFSFIFAGTALFIALVTGLCAALCLNHLDRIKAKNLAGFFDPLFMLPLSTSAVTLGFSIIITLDRPPLNLRSSILLVPLVHALGGFPFVLRAVLPALKSIPNNIREAASTLGAGPGNIFRCIDLPLISGALTAGAVFAFTISMGEFGATIFAAGPRTPTIPLAIYRFLGRPGAINYGQAMAISTLLMAITAAGFILIEKISSKGLQHF